MSTPQITEALARLQDKDSYVRAAAARALGEIGDVSAVPALIETLRDDHMGIRSSAAGALGKIGDVCAVPALIKRLKDEMDAVRCHAAHALSKIGDSVTLPRKILAASNFSAKERVEIVDRLRRVRYHADFRYFEDFSSLRYSFPNTRTLCQMVLKEEDMDARIGAQAVLNWLNGDRTLLIPSQQDTAIQTQELVRASQGELSEPHPETLLIAAESPNDTET